MSLYLTDSRRRRIREADPQDLARLVDQEHYWTPEAVREMLKRVETLSDEDPPQAVQAARSVIEIVNRRFVEPSASLQAQALTALGSALRIDGEPAEAVLVFEQALDLPSLQAEDRGRVLTRMTITLVYLNRLQAAQNAVDTAIRLLPTDPSALATRVWVHFVTGDFSATVRHGLQVLEGASPESSSDHAFLSAIVNIAASLSYGAGADVEPEVLERVQKAIARYRDVLADKGSRFYKVQRLRLLLSRAEALVLARTDQEDRAALILERVVQGLRPKLPDDALDASVDLMCLRAQMENEEAAAAEARRTLEIAEEADNRPGPVAMTVLRKSAEKVRLSLKETAELRIWLRTRS